MFSMRAQAAHREPREFTEHETVTVYYCAQARAHSGAAQGTFGAPPPAGAPSTGRQ